MIGEHATANRLYRSRGDRKIAGVAGGLAEYLKIDPVLVRLGFVGLALLQGVGLLIYIVMAMVVPERPAGEEEPAGDAAVESRHSRNVIGYVLAGLGLLLLAGNFGLYRILGGWDILWPLVLIAIGVLLLVSRNRG